MSVNSVNSQFSSSQGQPPSFDDIKSKLEALGIPDDVIEEGPDATKEYAEENNIDISSIQPPPPPSTSSSTSDSSTLNGSADSAKTDFESQLLALGVPQDIIDEGRDSVMEYASENNITLPSPPSGTVLNLQS